MNYIFKLLKEEILKEIDNRTYHYVYRGTKTNIEPVAYDNMFFSETEDYARAIGGQYIWCAIIYCYKPMYLDTYNEAAAKVGLTGIWGQPFFTLHADNIKDGYLSQIGQLRIEGLGDLVTQFQQELKTCDSIFGQDTGNNDTKVWYVKSAKQIEFI